jgi:hypothetical protein
VADLPPRSETPLPAVSPLPYIFVWLPLAGAHVQCFELLLGWTPELLDVSAEVFGVPLQLENLAPPGVSFVCESADGLLVEDAEVFDCAFACAVADAFALGPAVEFEFDDSSAFFAWPLFSAEAETVVVAVAEALALVDSCFAWPGGVPCGLSAQASDPVSALISAATKAAPRARLFIAAVSFRSENP